MCAVYTFIPVSYTHLFLLSVGQKKGDSDFSISKAPLNFETDLCLKGVFSQNPAE